MLSKLHLAALPLVLLASNCMAEDGVFVRFRLKQPEGATYFVRLGGYIHKENWYLKSAVIPEGADSKKETRITSGELTPWFDLKNHAGKDLHGRHKRAGGIAEFPFITAQFITTPSAAQIDVEIELATEASEQKIVKKWSTSLQGDVVGFLVSPNLVADAKDLELDSEMAARRLKWAEEASGGKRHSPKELLLQTQFWSPQRPEMNLKEARVLWLLGFNTVGNMSKEVREAFPDFRAPAASHDIRLELSASREDIAKSWEKIATPLKDKFPAGAPFNFSDEICARPPIGKDEKALALYRTWLAEHKIPPADFGVTDHNQIQPIETPDAFKEAAKVNEAAARRNFYYTSRFRQVAATDRLIWNTEELHKHLGAGARSSTLVADHPYFGGTGLGMGFYQQNTTWGGWPLANDWFDIARRGALDFIGIEDWMGLQYMYGPGATWEGFQLMGFQAAIFRSGSQGKMPIMSWITPSDERNLRLKAASSLCQGATNFFYWCYGPTATSTENYWSDLHGSYPGMTHLSRLLEFGEPALAKGRMRPTRVALLYSLSSDLWQPFGYVHMLERRGLYFSLIHDQYLVDFLTEEDIAAGRLKDYKVLYSADPCISTIAAQAIGSWVESGGTFVGTCAAGSRNQFGEQAFDIAKLCGIKADIPYEIQTCEYRRRGQLNSLKYIDNLKTEIGEFGIVGLKSKLLPDGGKAAGTLATDGTPIVVTNTAGKGKTVYIAATPGISYFKDANYVPADLAEKWPAAHRKFINQFAEQSGATPLVKLSEPVIEAGIYETDRELALVLANFAYSPIEKLNIELPMNGKFDSVVSLEHKKIKFKTKPAEGVWRDEGYTHVIQFTLTLGHDDLLLIKKK